MVIFFIEVLPETDEVNPVIKVMSHFNLEAVQTVHNSHKELVKNAALQRMLAG
jgi:hypothetical protein